MGSGFFLFGKCKTTKSIKAGMPKKQRINLAKVLAALNTPCPKCGHSIPPKERRHVDFEHIVCPKCGERFKPVARSPVG
jgi:ribosomal protein S27AE